jgi:Fic family protein
VANLILSQWRAELAWLPVETLMHYQQERYYQVLGMCDSQSDSTPFIEFMLENMVIALKDGMGQTASLSEEMSEKMSEEKVEMLAALRNGSSLLSKEPTRTAKDMAQEMDVSARTVERYLKTLQQKGRLQRTGAKKGSLAHSLAGYQRTKRDGQ